MPELASPLYERSGKVVLSLKGQHTAMDADRTLVMVNRLFHTLGKCEFVIDIRAVTGYEPAARSLWQEKLADLRKGIHTLTLVGGSPLIRMTAAAVCLYAGIKMRFVDDIEDAFGAKRHAG